MICSKVPLSSRVVLMANCSHKALRGISLSRALKKRQSGYSRAMLAVTLGPIQMLFGQDHAGGAGAERGSVGTPRPCPSACRLLGAFERATAVILMLHVFTTVIL